MKKIVLVSLFILFLLPIHAQAMIIDVDVNADLNSISPIWYQAGVIPTYSAAPVNTGLFLNPGDSLDISASGSWSNGYVAFSPNGNPNENIAAGYPGAGYPVAALMGKIGNSSYFFIGSDYSNTVSQSGVLYLGFNDTDYGNNWGTVTAHITDTPVPEPATMILFALGGLATAFLKKRKKVS